MNGRADDAAVQHCHNLPHILFAAHKGAVNFNLPGEQQAEVQFGPQAGGGAADGIAAAGAQGIKGAVEKFGAHMVNEGIHPGAAGQRLDPLGNILLLIVDNFVRAQFPGFGRLFRAAGGGNDPRAHHIFGDLNGGGADAGRGRQH